MLSSSACGTRLAPRSVTARGECHAQRVVKEQTMARESLEKRMDRLERRVEILEQLPERVAGVESQIVLLRDEMRSEFSAIREEIRAATRRPGGADREDGVPVRRKRAPYAAAPRGSGRADRTNGRRTEPLTSPRFRSHFEACGIRDDAQSSATVRVRDAGRCGRVSVRLSARREAPQEGPPKGGPPTTTSSPRSIATASPVTTRS